MSFGKSKKKKKEPVTRKLTQTHKITVDGMLNIESNDQILIELEEIGVVTLASILKEMDGQEVSIQVSHQRSDNLDIDLEFNETSQDEE